jgi:hypothetical protein
LDSLSEYHQYVTTKQTVIPESITLLRPYRGFFPFSVFQSRRATYPRRFPFRRLCCAPRVSHPLDALLPSRPSGPIPSRYRSWGLTLRGLHPHPVPYALSSAAPLGVPSSTQQRRGRPSRDSHTKQSPSPGLVVNQGSLRRMPPWAFPLRGFLPSTVENAHTLSHPLSCFPDPAAS